MQAIKESWSQIGVNVELNLMPGGPRFQIILDHEPDLGVQIIGNVPDVPDPMQMLALYYDSAAGGDQRQQLVELPRRRGRRDDRRGEAVDRPGGSRRHRRSRSRPAAAEQVPIIPILWSDLKYALRSDWTAGPMNGFSISNNFLSEITPR